MLRAVGAVSGGPDRLRLYAPDDALLFSNLDARRPGYAGAVAQARDAGFPPVVRLAGGHAAAFLKQSVAFAWATPDAEAHLRIQPRFERLTRWVVEALRGLGLDARIGALEGEYCPGEYSVNLAGRVKVMGVGQRVIRGAAHVGGVITVGQSEALRSVLRRVYADLDLPFDASTAGGLADFDPSITPDRLIEALVEVVQGDGFQVHPRPLEAAVVESAQALIPLHEAHRPRAAGAALRVHGAGPGGAKTLVQEPASSSPSPSIEDS
jgi:octanoyl-[GcvH]:protein N-octanoyltransferase